MRLEFNGVARGPFQSVKEVVLPQTRKGGIYVLRTHFTGVNELETSERFLEHSLIMKIPLPVLCDKALSFSHLCPHSFTVLLFQDRVSMTRQAGNTRTRWGRYKTAQKTRTKNYASFKSGGIFAPNFLRRLKTWETAPSLNSQKRKNSLSQAWCIN